MSQSFLYVMVFLKIIYGMDTPQTITNFLEIVSPKNVTKNTDVTVFTLPKFQRSNVHQFQMIPKSPQIVGVLVSEDVPRSSPIVDSHVDSDDRTIQTMKFFHVSDIFRHQTTLELPDMQPEFHPNSVQISESMESHTFLESQNVLSDIHPRAPSITESLEPTTLLKSSNLFLSDVLPKAPRITDALISETVSKSGGIGTKNHKNDNAILEDPMNNNADANLTSNITNITGHAPTFEPSAMTRVMVLLVIAVVALVGNVATLWSILRTGRQSTSTVYMLLVQLALADLLVTFFCIFAEALWTLTVDWRAGDLACRLFKFMQMFALYLSTFVLVLIGFDRLCAVRFPMHRAHAKHRVRQGIAVVWILSAVFSIPQAVVFRVVQGPFLEEFHQCVTHGAYSAEWQEQLYTSLSLVLMFLLPLVLLLAAYATTFATIASQENLFSERVSRTPVDDARHKLLRKAKLKSLMITVVIVLAFVVCWTPYYVTMLVFVFLQPDEQTSEKLLSAIFFFGSSTAMINPLIYGAFHLRRRAPSSRKSTSGNDRSASSRVESSLVHRKAHHHHHPGGRMVDGEETTSLTHSPTTGKVMTRNQTTGL